MATRGESMIGSLYIDVPVFEASETYPKIKGFGKSK